MAAFYFKQTRRTGERAYEFTHKTFGEYLAACRLVDAIAETEQERADKRDKRRRWDEEAALVSWIRLSGPAAIDRDLLRFIQRQIAVAQEDEDPELVGRWQQTNAELLSYELDHGLPMHLLGLSTFQEMTRQARNAEEALLVAHFCCASTARKPSPIRWQDPLTLRDLLARLGQGGPWPLAANCLGWLGGHEDSSNHWLYQANLEGAILQGAILQGANLEGANLVGVRGLDVASGLDKVKSWRGAKIERKWVERLGLDAEKLGLEVVNDLDEEEPANPTSPQV
jgi:Pentapeptide repeats (8 copies)